jgi:DNA-directed RNA polymerase specialized sigma24 family protein
MERLQSLPPQARAAVYLVDLEGLSIGEAAALIGLSVTATRARLSRARRTVREQDARQRGETA